MPVQDLIVGAGALGMAAVLLVAWLAAARGYGAGRRARHGPVSAAECPTEPLRLGELGGAPATVPVTMPIPRPYASTLPIPLPPPYVLYVPGVPRLVSPPPPGHPEPTVPPWMLREPPIPTYRCGACRDGRDVIGPRCFRCRALPLVSAPERTLP